MLKNEEKKLKEALATTQDQVVNLQLQVNKSSVQAVDKANRERDEAYRERDSGIRKAQSTAWNKIYEADNRRICAESERDNANTRLKKRTFLYLGLLSSVLFLVSLRNIQFLSDLIDFFTVPAIFSYERICDYLSWLITPSYYNGKNQIAFTTGWAWALRIITLLLVLAAIYGVIYATIRLIKWYRNRWCTLSIKVLVLSYAVLGVFGDTIRSVVPINLILLLLISQLVYLITLWYLDGYFLNRCKLAEWEQIQNC